MPARAGSAPGRKLPPRCQIPTVPLAPRVDEPVSTRAAPNPADWLLTGVPVNGAGRNRGRRLEPGIPNRQVQRRRNRSRFHRRSTEFSDRRRRFVAAALRLNRGSLESTRPHRRARLGRFHGGSFASNRAVSAGAGFGTATGGRCTGGASALITGISGGRMTGSGIFKAGTSRFGGTKIRCTIRGFGRGGGSGVSAGGGTNTNTTGPCLKIGATIRFPKMTRSEMPAACRTRLHASPALDRRCGNSSKANTMLPRDPFRSRTATETSILNHGCGRP